MTADVIRFPPVDLDDKDLELFEYACRRNAARCRGKGAIDEAAK